MVSLPLVSGMSLGMSLSSPVRWGAVLTSKTQSAGLGDEDPDPLALDPLALDPALPSSPSPMATTLPSMAGAASYF